MSWAFVGSLAGAVVGFLTGCVCAAIASGGEVMRDTIPFTLLFACFLAGPGAIAGAVIGGVSDLREFCAKKDRASDREALK